jgi:hypothetical protein
MRTACTRICQPATRSLGPWSKSRARAMAAHHRMCHFSQEPAYRQLGTHGAEKPSPCLGGGMRPDRIGAAPTTCVRRRRQPRSSHLRLGLMIPRWTSRLDVHIASKLQTGICSQAPRYTSLSSLWVATSTSSPRSISRSRTSHRASTAAAIVITPPIERMVFRPVRNP